MGCTGMPVAKGGNQAVAAARAGARVRMVAAVGADEAGAAYRRRLEAGIEAALTVVGVDAAGGARSGPAGGHHRRLCR